MNAQSCGTKPVITVHNKPEVSQSGALDGVQYMGWIDNLISYCDSSDPGKCPMCGSENMEVLKHINEKRESITFRCNTCGATDHFDGMTTSKG